MSQVGWMVVGVIVAAAIAFGGVAIVAWRRQRAYTQGEAKRRRDLEAVAAIRDAQQRRDAVQLRADAFARPPRHRSTPPPPQIEFPRDEAGGRERPRREARDSGGEISVPMPDALGSTFWVPGAVMMSVSPPTDDRSTRNDAGSSTSTYESISPTSTPDAGTSPSGGSNDGGW